MPGCLANKGDGTTLKDPQDTLWRSAFFMFRELSGGITCPLTWHEWPGTHQCRGRGCWNSNHERSPACLLPYPPATEGTGGGLQDCQAVRRRSMGCTRRVGINPLALELTPLAEANQRCINTVLT